jgi:hypothetical protein
VPCVIEKPQNFYETHRGKCVFQKISLFYSILQKAIRSTGLDGLVR